MSLTLLGGIMRTRHSFTAYSRTILGVAAAFVVLIAGGCGSVVHKPLVAASEGPRQIAIFLDGTHNDASSDTNIKKLHSLVSLQGRMDIATLYVEGVGTGNDVLGMSTGLGIGSRVRIAYEFILNHYRPEDKTSRSRDKIHIFGFSRGAYSARILTSLLYHAGLPTVGIDGKQRTATEIADIVFRAVKDDELVIGNAEPQRQAWVARRLREAGLEPGEPVDVEVLGLWDTVEALGIPDWDAKIVDKLGGAPYVPNVDDANPRYGDKLCNVHHAFHAVSLDDDREWVFTPLLLTRQHLFNGCTPGRVNPLLGVDNQPLPGRLHEVWFAGAHSDVGGGYADTLLSGVSLNWMIKRLCAAVPGLLPSAAAVRADPYGSSHDPEAGVWSPLYHAQNRNVVGYALDGAKPDRTDPIPEHLLRGTVCVHRSVIERRRFAPPKEHEYRQLSLRKYGVVHLVPDSSPEYSGMGRLRERTGDDPPGDDAATIEVRECKDGIR